MLMDVAAAVASLKNKLEQLETGLIEQQQQLFYDQTLNQVASLLLTQTTAVTVLEAATELLAALFTHDVVKKAMANTRPVVDALFFCLKNKPVVAKNILTAIGNLTAYQDPSQNWLVSDYDAIHVIVNVLNQNSQLADVQSQAFYALQKIACGNEVNIRTLFNYHKAHELVLASIATHANQIPVLTQACALFRRFSWLPENQAILMTTAVAIVLQLMRSFASVPELQEHGCTLLNNLARHVEYKKLLVREPYFSHETILSAMRNHPEVVAVQEMGCGALKSLADDDDNKKMLVREPYLAHQVILGAMRNHLQIAAIQEMGCGALWSLAADNENSKLLVREPDLAHQAVLAAMRNHPQIAAVQEMGCGVLKNLFDDDESRRLLVQEPDLAHQVILSAMRNHPQTAAIQEQGCWALANLAASYNEIQKVLVQCDAHVTIVAALQIHSQDEEVQRYAVWALALMSFEVSVRAALKRADTLPLCEKALRNFPKNNDLETKLAILQTRLA